MIDLFISFYNRPEYLQKSLESLSKSFDKVIPHIHLTDDGSNDAETIKISEYFRYKVFTNNSGLAKEPHKGIPEATFITINKHVLQSDYKNKFFITSDSDMIYKNGWLDKLIELYELTNAPLITSFNTHEQGEHRNIEYFNGYAKKDHTGGCNLLIDLDFYKNSKFYLDGPRWDWTMCEKAHQIHSLGVITTIPSYSQHIGEIGVHWGIQAEDF